MKLLVTGATGHLGKTVVETLLKKVSPEEIIVSVRNPEKAEDLKARGVEVRYGDFDKPESLKSAFHGIDRVLIISADGDNETRIRQHLTAVAAAAEANVKRIVYTSIANATESKLELAEVHRTTEAEILKTGISYVFLRNNWYLENEISSIQGAIQGAPWISAAGEGKTGWSLRRDYGEAAASALAGDEHENKIYELSNKPITQSELAAATAKVIDKSVSVLNVSDEDYAEGLKKAGLPDFLISMLGGIQKAMRADSLNVESNDFESLLGRKATPIEEAVAEIVNNL